MAACAHPEKRGGDDEFCVECLNELLLAFSEKWKAMAAAIEEVVDALNALASQ